MRELIIDRTKWYRGQGSALSALRVGHRSLNGTLTGDSAGKMCCLGFEMKAGGYTEDELTNVPMPSSLTSDPKFPEQSKWLVQYQSTAVECPIRHSLADDDAMGQHLLASVNDERGLSEDKREAYIIARFAEHDVKVVFIN